jgi:hypothetical protein
MTTWVMRASVCGFWILWWDYSNVKTQDIVSGAQGIDLRKGLGPVLWKMEVVELVWHYFSNKSCMLGADSSKILRSICGETKTLSLLGMMSSV